MAVIWLKERSEAAEARCARLQQALARVRENAKAWHGSEGLDTGHARALAVIAEWCDEALAGQDTPADSQEHDPETLMDSYIAADSQEDKT